jgi:hypothetical protein
MGVICMAADIKKIKKGIKEAEDIAAGITGILAAVALLEPLTKEVVKKVDERKDFVDIPPLYSKNIPIKLERATVLLEDRGLKVESVAVQEANIKFKDCLDQQVVWSKPKHKQKVKPGTLVFLRYVTSEIIKRSQELFEELERQKIETKQANAIKRAEQKEKIKKKIGDTVINVKQNINSIRRRS